MSRIDELTSQSSREAHASDGLGTSAVRYVTDTKDTVYPLSVHNVEVIRDRWIVKVSSVEDRSAKKKAPPSCSMSELTDLAKKVDARRASPSP